MNILLTGARAPVALELTRRFARAGHQVHLSDSVRFPLAGFSKYVTAFHALPSARQEPQRFAREIRELRACFDLLIPTCEEVLWVSQFTTAFCPDLETLKRLHNKWLFTQEAQALGLGVPRTWLLQDRAEALELWRRESPLVLKPVYSRFATHTLIKPKAKQLPPCHQDWVAQEFWEGQHYCSFSVAHKGALTAHVVYEPTVRLHGGAGVLIRSVTHPAIDDWVTRFVSSLGLTGQFAFDFIEDRDGRVAALECNPRTTSGVHLFAQDGQLAQAYLRPSEGCLIPEPNQKSMLTLAAMFSAPLRCMKERARPIIWEPEDPRPALGQVLSFLEFLNLGRRHGLLNATTHDIAWDDSCEF